MAILDDVKMALRISHNRLDTELTAEIAACKKDLELAGVVNIEDADGFVATAISTYVRGVHDYSGKGAQYLDMYERIKNTMALSTLYNTEVTSDA